MDAGLAASRKQRSLRRKTSVDKSRRAQTENRAAEKKTDKAASTAELAKKTAEAFDMSSLPPIDSIVATTDIRPFLAPGVPAELTRAALQKAWRSDPAIRDFIGLSENSWDFNDPNGMHDVGFSRDELLRRPDRHAQHRQDRGRWRALHAVPHDGALLADPLVPPDRAQPHPQQHGLHHRGGHRLPERQRHDPARERDAARDPGRARLEHLHGRQVAPLPRRRDEPRLDAAQLAERPRLRALVRLPRRRDQPVVSRSWSTTTTRSTSRSRPRRATTSRST